MTRPAWHLWPQALVDISSSDWSVIDPTIVPQGTLSPQNGQNLRFNIKPNPRRWKLRQKCDNSSEEGRRTPGPPSQARTNARVPKRNAWQQFIQENSSNPHTSIWQVTISGLFWQLTYLRHSNLFSTLYVGGAAYSDPYPHLPAAAAEVQEGHIAKTLMRAQHSELILDI